jgi:hypothetical protein
MLLEVRCSLLLRQWTWAVDRGEVWIVGREGKQMAIFNSHYLCSFFCWLMYGFHNRCKNVWWIEISWSKKLHFYILGLWFETSSRVDRGETHYSCRQQPQLTNLLCMRGLVGSEDNILTTVLQSIENSQTRLIPAWTSLPPKWLILYTRPEMDQLSGLLAKLKNPISF